MGFFDWFEPDPPVHCLKCKRGIARGWQEKHSDHGLFLWRQGVAAPVDQLVDDDLKLPTEELSGLRLPQDQNLSIYYGQCDSCGAHFPFHLDLAFTNDTWTGFSQGEHVRHAVETEPGWLQCPDCFDAQEIAEGHTMIHCPHCHLLLIKQSFT
jgi:hypothetical protein